MIKKFLKFFLLYIFALITTNQIWQNLHFQYLPQTIFKVALILTIFEILLKPIIKILLLPINLLTLGTIRLIIDTLGLYIATFFTADFIINNISTSPFVFLGVHLPSFNFSGFWNYFVTSLTLGFIIYIFKLILIKKQIKK